MLPHVTVDHAFPSIHTVHDVSGVNPLNFYIE